MIEQKQMTDNSTQNLSQSLQAMTPKSLDDIIRMHRDFAQLRLTNDEEILSLNKEVMPATPKDIVDDWNLITLVKPGSVLVFLIGEIRHKGTSRMTSDVTSLDLDRGFLKTKSGSLYQLGKQNAGPPNQSELYLVCSTFHKWGFGDALGVPNFFY